MADLKGKVLSVTEFLKEQPEDKKEVCVSELSVICECEKEDYKLIIKGLDADLRKKFKFFDESGRPLFKRRKLSSADRIEALRFPRKLGPRVKVESAS